LIVPDNPPGVAAHGKILSFYAIVRRTPVGAA